MAFLEKDKIKIIRWYKQNGENLTQTAKKFKVSRTAIQAWLKNTPTETINSIEKSVENVIKAQESGYKGVIENYLKGANEIIQASNKRILELIPECKSIAILLELNQKLNPITLENERSKTEDGAGDGENKPGDQYNILVQNIMKQQDEAWKQIDLNKS